MYLRSSYIRQHYKHQLLRHFEELHHSFIKMAVKWQLTAKLENPPYSHLYGKFMNKEYRAMSIKRIVSLKKSYISKK